MNGDVLIDISDIQNAEFILAANPGQFYQYPTVGYGVNKKLYGTFDKLTETSNIKQALEQDSIKVSTIDINKVGDNNQVDIKFKSQ